VLEGWRPGVAKRLGADHPTLSRGNSSLVYCSISGFGQDGPWRDRSGHDINYLALAGYLGVQAAVEGRPWPPPILVSDLASGLYATIMVLAALNGRGRSGEGTYIDLSMIEAALSLLGPEIGSLAGDSGAATEPNMTAIPHYGVFRCADGRWFSLGIVDEDHFWRRFCAAVGLTDLADLTYPERVERGNAITEAVRSAFSKRPASEWESLLRDADVPAAPVTALSDLFDNPQFKARGIFRNIDSSRFLAQPFKLSGESVGPTGGPPGQGEHAAAILSELGYDAEQAEALRLSGALGPPRLGAGT
jgi:crotonobetainyl-CoA:carnitine CoA-transferase CaiB-like acyl-CoA transferase